MSAYQNFCCFFRTSRSTPAETPKPSESTTSEAKASGEKKSTSGGAVQLTDLQSILSNMQGAKAFCVIFLFMN